MILEALWATARSPSRRQLRTRPERCSCNIVMMGTLRVWSSTATNINIHEYLLCCLSGEERVQHQGWCRQVKTSQGRVATHSGSVVKRWGKQDGKQVMGWDE